MWFSDFVMAHRLMGITRLISIEKESNALRAKYNKPFACIEVREGDSTDVLGAFENDFWNTPAIMWLDYDGTISESVVHDINLAAGKLHNGSCLIVTVNGQRGSYRSKIDNNEKVWDTVSNLIGSSRIPAKHSRGNGNISNSEFPGFLADCVDSTIASEIAKSGRNADNSLLQYLPAFNFVHEDGAPMVTVGGFLANAKITNKLLDCIPEQRLPCGDWKPPERTRLDLVQLTLKEKLAMDERLPCDIDEFISATEACGIKLKQAQLKRYHHFYRQFPTFVESFS